MLVLQNAYWNVDVDKTRHLVRVKRTAERLKAIDELDAVFGELVKSIKDIQKNQYGLLIDLRDGPFRNDEAFETAIRKHTVELLNGWRKSALLMKTAVGALQAGRQARETGTAQNLFRDEDEAIQFLES